eukprot:jgi/Chlat1/1219/Chrsp115S01680
MALSLSATTAVESSEAHGALQYIYVCEEGSPSARRKRCGHARYTRSQLTSMLQLMVVKPRHAQKISDRIWERLVGAAKTAHYVGSSRHAGFARPGDGRLRHVPRTSFDHCLCDVSTSAATGGIHGLTGGNGRQGNAASGMSRAGRFSGISVGSDLSSDRDSSDGPLAAAGGNALSVNGSDEDHLSTSALCGKALWVSRSHFLDQVAKALAEFNYTGKDLTNDVMLACSIKERRASVTVLLCGTSGCGKSTLASLLASRLGITTVVSTDSVRHMLRSFTPKSENPLLWASTYHAGEVWQSAPGVDGSVAASLTDKQRIVKGYKAQSEMVMDSLERLIGACEKRRESLVIEGVHLSLNFVVNLMRRHPTDYLCQRADKKLIPKIDNTNVDRSVVAIHATVFGCLRRRTQGEQLLDATTNTTKLVHAEFQQQHSAMIWSSKANLELIRGTRLRGLDAGNSTPSTSSSTPRVLSFECEFPDTARFYDYRDHDMVSSDDGGDATSTSSNSDSEGSELPDADTEVGSVMDGMQTSDEEDSVYLKREPGMLSPVLSESSLQELGNTTPPSYKIIDMDQSLFEPRLRLAAAPAKGKSPVSATHQQQSHNTLAHVNKRWKPSDIFFAEQAHAASLASNGDRANGASHAGTAPRQAGDDSPAHDASVSYQQPHTDSRRWSFGKVIHKLRSSGTLSAATASALKVHRSISSLVLPHKTHPVLRRSISSAQPSPADAQPPPG